MNHIQLITQILTDNIQVPIDYSQIVSEHYTLFVSELDVNLLPNKTNELLTDKTVNVYYYAYNQWIIYIITNIETNIPIITGLLFKDKLQAYIIN